MTLNKFGLKKTSVRMGLEQFPKEEEQKTTAFLDKI